MKKIALLGAFDRFNYGDLFFPIITEKFLLEFKYIRDNYIIEYYGLRRKDLSHYGGKKSQPFNVFINKKNDDNSVVIVVGGEVLGADWYVMYKHLSSRFVVFCLKIIKRFIGIKNINYFTKVFLLGKSTLPWIVNRNTLRGKTKVVYNSIGGAGFDKLNKEYKEEIVNNFKKADFVSVRDRKTKQLLNSSKDDLQIGLAPDCVILLSKYFLLGDLFKRLSLDIYSFASKEKKYIVFQIGLKCFKNNEAVIINSLEEIYKKYNLEIVLLPIGRVPDHSDQIALRKIKNKIKVPVFLFSKCNIYDIAYLIAKSKLFMGTSLHGSITAITYAVPSLGLDKRVSKLDSFIKTWNIINGLGCIDYSEILDKFSLFYNYDKQALEAKRKELIELSYDNLIKVHSVINNSK